MHKQMGKYREKGMDEKKVINSQRKQMTKILSALANFLKMMNAADILETKQEVHRAQHDKDTSYSN